MQTTLLGLAIAIIAVLAGALAAPLVVDWTAFRPLIEARLSRALGAPVVLAGPVDAALLPTPRFTLRAVAIGGGDSRATIAEVRGSLSLGALLRGEIICEELALIAPRLTLVVDAEGRLAGPALAAALPVETLSVRGARVSIDDRHLGRTVTADDVTLAGALGGAEGPVRLEGAAMLAGVRVPVRLSAAARGAEPGAKLRLALKPPGAALEFDGTLDVEDGRPTAAGAVTASVATADGRTLRAAGQMRASPAALRFDTVAVTLGPEDRPQTLEGAARLDLGPHPRLDAVLNARQLDLDQMLPKSPKAPLAAVHALMAPLAMAADLSVRLGLSVDAAVIGGETVRDIRADLARDDGAITVEHAEARLPGRADLRVAGEIDSGYGFRGVVAVEAADPAALVGWLAGAPADRLGGPLKAQASVTARPGHVALDTLTIEGAGTQLAGGLRWTRGATGRATLAADLAGAALDLDALRPLADAVGLAPARLSEADVRLSLAVDALRHGGIAARRIEARMGVAAGALTVEALRIADYGGLTIDAHGTLARRDNRVTGRLGFDLAVAEGAGARALAEAAALPGPLAQRLMAAVLPARLSGELAANAEGDTVSLAARGEAAGGPAALTAAVPVAAPSTATVHVEGPGGALLALAGLEAPGAGRLTAEWRGLAEGGGAVAATLAMPALAAEARGRLALREGRLDPDLTVTIAEGDLAALAPGLAGPLPVAGSVRLVRAGEALRAEAIALRVAGAALSGALVIGAGSEVSVTGHLATDRLDGPAVVAALIGRSGAARGWSAEPFGRPAVPAARLDVTVTTPRLALSDGVTVADATLALTHTAPRSALRLLGGALGGGPARGTLTLVRAEGGIAASLEGSLAGADLAAVLPGAGARPAGRLALDMSVTGAGRSPAAVIASLTGQGRLALEELSWPALSPGVGAALAPLAQNGMPDERQVQAAAAAALAQGPLDVPRVATTLAIVSGQVRAAPVTAEAAGAKLTAFGTLDLDAGMLDGGLDIVPGPPAETAAVGVRWSGPVSAPRRALDVSAALASLTLAAVERQRSAPAAEQAAGPETVAALPAAAEAKPEETPAKPINARKAKPRLAKKKPPRRRAPPPDMAPPPALAEPFFFERLGRPFGAAPDR